MIRSIEWTGKSLRVIDQSALPARVVYRRLKTISEVYEAVQKLRVRGAPLLGVTAAFGLYLGMLEEACATPAGFIHQARKHARYLSQARPTAVNVDWALNLALHQLSQTAASPRRLLERLLDFAIGLEQDDERRCEKIGQHGARLISNGMTVLTHCNTGALATTGIGTALGVMTTAFRQGRKFEVLVDETRPLLQGARLTLWELKQHHIPATLITDSMAAYAMQQGRVNLVLVGADRIAANGDVANKIGTYSLAVLAAHHRIPFYVAAPFSTFDRQLPDGSQIPIEERDPREVKVILGKLPIAHRDSACWNPAFDVTPAELISGIITEDGILYPPFVNSVKQLNQFTYQNQEEVSL